MALFVAIILGIFFVLLDVSALPMLGKGFIIFDFALFYLNSLVYPFKERVFLFLGVISIFKSFFLIGNSIPWIFFLYSLSVLILFILERILNIESIVLTLIISMLFLFVEAKLVGISDFRQLISTLSIHLVVWIFLINILRSLFKTLQKEIKRPQIKG